MVEGAPGSRAWPLPLPFSAFGEVFGLTWPTLQGPSVHIMSTGQPIMESNETDSFRKGGLKPLQVCEEMGQNPEEEDGGEPEG